MRGVRVLVRMSLVVPVVVAVATPAAAHGPCHCLTPSAGPPGTTVSVPKSYGAVEVLWNPNPRRLGNPALVGSRWARLFDRDLPTASLAKQEDPGPISFEVPRVPYGRYLVVIFDLSEGGPRNHYTWATFSVRRTPALPSTGGAGASAVLAAAIAALVAGEVVLSLGRGRPSIRSGGL